MLKTGDFDSVFSDKQRLKYFFSLEDLIDFIFPPNLQHPLAASRLIAFALYGPLDESNRLRCGRDGLRVLLDYELNQMCLQIEREDIIQIYLHNPRDLAVLTTAEQDSIINQADNHLKCTKGKGSLPAITKADVVSILNSVSRDESGNLNFHEAQKVILDFRRARSQRLKLVYPQLEDTGTPLTVSSKTFNFSNSTSAKSRYVSECVAPTTMFEKMKGLRNADIVETTTSYLNKNSYKIMSAGDKSSYDIVSNVRLIREMIPKCKDPYVRKNGSRIKSEWNKVSNMTGNSAGSFVNAIPSSTTWKRKYTSY